MCLGLQGANIEIDRDTVLVIGSILPSVRSVEYDKSSLERDADFDADLDGGGM